MEVAHTSMIHATAPHFLWSFAVRYVARQLNLWPRVSLPETSPTLCWTGKVGDASVFQVYGTHAFVHDTSADKLSSRAIPCFFLGFLPNAPGWQFYHPTSRRVLPSQDVTFDESFHVYRLFPYRSAPLPPPLLFLSPGAGSGGAEPGGAEPGGTEPEGAELGGAESEGAESRGPEPKGTASAGGPAGASPRLYPRREPLSAPQLREWFAQRTPLRSGAVGAGGSAAGGTGAGGAGATSPGGAGVPAGAGGTRGAGAAGPGGARTRGTGAAGAGGVGGAGAGGVGAGDPVARGAGAGGAGAVGAGAGDPGAGGAGVGGTGTGGAGAGGAGGGDPSAGGDGAGGTGAGGAGAGGAGAGGAGAVDPGAGVAGARGAASGGTGAGGTVQRRSFFVPPAPSSLPPPDSVLRQVLSLLISTGLPPSLLSPPPRQSQPQLQPPSPLPAPSPYVEQTDSFTERREPESRPASRVRAVRTGRRVPRPRPPPVPGTHVMALRSSSLPLRVPLPPPLEYSLPAVPDPESDLARAASPTVPRLLATIITNPSFESAAVSALVAELVEFAATCRLDYATSLVAESESDCPPSVGGECALGTDVLEDRQEEFECLAATVPHLVAMLLASEGDPNAPDLPTPRSYAEAITGTYVDAIPPSGANIVDGMWIFRVKRPPSSLPVFKDRYVARGFTQRQGVDFFHTFSPTPKMTTLRVLLNVVAQRYYELHSLDFSTAFLQGSLHEEIRLRRPPGFTESFPPVASLRSPSAPSTADPSLFLCTDTSLPPFYVVVYVDDFVFATADIEALALVKSELQKRHTCTDLGELHSYFGLQITRDRARCTITLTQSHMVQQVLQRFGFRYSSPQSTPLPTGHSLSAPPSDESVEPSGPYPELVGYLMYLMTCTRPDLAYPLSILARYVATVRHRKEHMDAAKRVLRYLCSTSGMGLVLGGRARVVLTGQADASWVDDLATQRSSEGYTFSLGSGSVSWRSTRSSSVLSSSCEAEIYDGAMAAQELRWLTYLLTDLGEAPRSSPVLYVDNKAMIALCQEHRLEHRTKHIALH
ncbi:unnamed protein product [Closterium sp. NIES-53]